MTNLVPGAPAAPAAPTVASVPDNQNALSVRWTAPAANNSAVTDYDLRYFAGSADPSDADDWIEEGETSGHTHTGTATTATITGLTANTEYRVQVRAQNAKGESAWSPSGSATTATTPPGAPAAPTVSAVSSSRNLSVSWAAPATGGSAVTGYDLRLFAGSADPTDEADWVLRNESNGIPDLRTNTGTSATLTGLAASTAYRVQVRATNGVVWGPWSPTGTATTNNTASTTNRAPIRMKLGTPAEGCIEKTDDTVFGTILASSNTLGSLPNVLDRSQCGAVSDRRSIVFSDPDNDTLTITAQLRGELPENVRLGDGTPFVQASGDQVLFVAVAAYRRTEFDIDLTATDPHGASVSTFFTVSLRHLANSGAPRFEAQAESLSLTRNEAIEPVVLPAATGGDVRGAFTSVLSPKFALQRVPPVPMPMTDRDVTSPGERGRSR